MCMCVHHLIIICLLHRHCRRRRHRCMRHIAIAQSALCLLCPVSVLCVRMRLFILADDSMQNWMRQMKYIDFLHFYGF